MNCASCRPRSASLDGVMLGSYIEHGSLGASDESRLSVQGAGSQRQQPADAGGEARAHATPCPVEWRAGRARHWGAGTGRSPSELRAVQQSSRETRGNGVEALGSMCSIVVEPALQLEFFGNGNRLSMPSCCHHLHPVAESGLYHLPALHMAGGVSAGAGSAGSRPAAFTAAAASKGEADTAGRGWVPYLAGYQAATGGAGAVRGRVFAGLPFRFSASPCSISQTLMSGISRRIST